MRAAAMRPGGGGRADLGRQIGHVARHPDPGHLRRPRRVGRDVLTHARSGARPPPARARPGSLPARPSAARPPARPAATVRPSRSRTPVRRSSTISSAATSPSTTAMPRAASCSACSSVERRAAAEEDDVVAQLPEQQRLVHRHRAARQHADRLVAHLPAVAVRAVQHVAAPPLPQPGHVRQLVDQPGGHQQPARPHRPAVGQRHREPVVGRRDAVDLAGRRSGRRSRAPPRGPSRAARPAAMPSRPSRPCTPGRRRVARRARVDHQHRPPGPGQHQRPAQPGGAAADHHHVVARRS